MALPYFEMFFIILQEVTCDNIWLLQFSSNSKLWIAFDTLFRRLSSGFPLSFLKLIPTNVYMTTINKPFEKPQKNPGWMRALQEP